MKPYYSSVAAKGSAATSRIVGGQSVEATLQTPQAQRAKTTLLDGRSLTTEEHRGLLHHLDGDIGLRSKHHFIGDSLAVDRMSVLSHFMNKLRQSNCLIEGCYLSGSSVNTALADKARVADLDFTATVANLPKEPNESTRSSLLNLMCKTLSEVSGNKVSVEEAAQWFGMADFENRRSRSQVYIISLGNDTDLVISSQAPNYALAHQGRAIDVLSILQDQISLQGKSKAGPRLEYMENSQRVESAIKNLWIRPSDDNFIHWSHIVPVAKSISKGFTFANAATATKFYNSALSAMQSTTSKFAADGVSWQLSKKFNGLKTEALLGMALDLPSRVSDLKKDAKTSVSLFSAVLRGALFTKQRALDGAAESKQMKNLISHLSSQKNESFVEASRDLNALLVLNHLITYPEQPIKRGVEELPNRHHVDTDIAGITLGVTFDSAGLQRSPRFNLKSSSDWIVMEEKASLLISEWPEEQINRVYEVAQTLELTRVNELIESYREVLSSRASSSASLPDLANNLDEITISELVEQYQPHTARPPIRDGRWFIGDKSYALSNISRSPIIGENGFPEGTVNIRWHGKDIALSHLQQNGDKVQADMTMALNQLGLSGSAVTKAEIDSRGHIHIVSTSSDSMELGPLQYVGKLKDCYLSDGKFSQLQPIGMDAEIQVKGKPSVTIVGDILNNGQVQVKLVNGQAIDALSCYVEWDQLANLNTCLFNVKMVLDAESGLQMDAKHKLVTEKVPIEDSASLDAQKRVKRGKKNKAVKTFEWKTELVAMEGQLSIYGGKQQLEFSNASEQRNGAILLRDPRENGVITYRLGHDIAQGVVTAVEVEANEQICLQANNLKSAREELGVGRSGQPLVADVQRLLIATAVKHLNGSMVVGNSFHEVDSTISTRAKLMLTGTHFDISYSGDRLKVLTLQAALPLDGKAYSPNMAAAAERDRFAVDDLPYAREVKIKSQEDREKRYKKKKRSQQTERTSAAVQQKVFNRSFDLTGGNQSKSASLTLTHGEPKWEWQADEIIGLAVSPDGSREVTVPFQKKGDSNAFQYLLRYRGGLGDVISLGENVSTLTLLKHLRPFGDIALDDKLHPPVYGLQDAASDVSFVQFTQHFSLCGSAPVVTGVEISSNQLSAVWQQGDTVVLKPHDATVYPGKYVPGENGEPVILLDRQPRIYSDICFRKGPSLATEASNVSQTGGLYTHALKLEDGMNVAIKEDYMSLQAVFKRECVGIRGDKLEVCGELPEVRGKDKFSVKATKIPGAMEGMPFILSIYHGDQTQHLQILPYEADMKGLEGYNLQQLRLIELCETAMRSAIFYRSKIEPVIEEAKELVHVDTSKIELPSGLW